MNRISILCSAFLIYQLLSLHANDRFSDLDDFSGADSTITEEKDSSVKSNSDPKQSVKTKKTLTLPMDGDQSKESISEYNELYQELNKKNNKKESNAEKESDRLLYQNDKDTSDTDGFSYPKSDGANLLYTFLGITAFSILFLIWWYQKHMKRKLTGAGISVSVLGQTWIDGSTRVILLKVGPKIITIAKSNQFCTPLDIISDPEEVNFLTLSSSIPQDQSEFKNVFSRAKKKSKSSNNSGNIPNASEIKMELDDLKKQLGQM